MLQENPSNDELIESIANSLRETSKQTPPCWKSLSNTY